MFIDEERTKNLKFHRKERRSTCTKANENVRIVCGTLQFYNDPQGVLLERQGCVQSVPQTSVSENDRPKYQDKINRIIDVRSAMEPVKIRRSENLPKSLPIISMGNCTAKKLTTTRNAPECKTTQPESSKKKHDRIVDSSASCSGESSQTVRFQDEEMTESKKIKQDRIVDSSASCSGKRSQTVRFQDERMTESRKHDRIVDSHASCSGESSQTVKLEDEEMTELEREVGRIVEESASCSRTMSLKDEETDVISVSKKKYFPLPYFCADSILKDKNPLKIKKLEMPSPAVGKLHMKITSKKNCAKIISKLQNNQTKKKRKRIVEWAESSSDEEMKVAKDQEIIENDSLTPGAPVLNDPVPNSPDEVIIVDIVNRAPSNFKRANSVMPENKDWSDDDLQVIEVKKNDLLNKIEFFYLAVENKHNKEEKPVHWPKYIFNWHTHRAENVTDSVLSSDVHHWLTPRSG